MRLRREVYVGLEFRHAVAGHRCRVVRLSRPASPWDRFETAWVEEDLPGRPCLGWSPSTVRAHVRGDRKALAYLVYEGLEYRFLGRGYRIVSTDGDRVLVEHTDEGPWKGYRFARPERVVRAEIRGDLDASSTREPSDVGLSPRRVSPTGPRRLVLSKVREKTPDRSEPGEGSKPRRREKLVLRRRKA